MSAPGDNYGNMPTWHLIDDLLDNRAEVYQKAKKELLARRTHKKVESLRELVSMEEPSS